MATPTFWVKYAASSDPFTVSPTWTDISSRLRSASWTRGRGSMVDEVAAGTATLRLKNHDRHLEPGFAAGPYNPIRPYRPMNIGCTWNSTDYSLFYGFVESWNVLWDSSWASVYSEVEVHLVDAIGVLAQGFVPDFNLQESASVRIGKVLDNRQFPAGMRSLTGGPQVRPVAAGKGSYLAGWTHIQDCVRSASTAVCAADRRGYMVYPASGGSATFGDAAGELKYTATNLNWGVDLVYTRIKVTAGDGGAEQSATGDPTRYGWREHSRTTINISDAAAATLANALLTLYGTPKPRLEGFTVRPGTSDDLWNAVITLDTEGTVIVKRRPPGGGTMFQQTHKLVGLDWSLDGYHPHDTTIQYTLAGTTTF